MISFRRGVNSPAILNDERPKAEVTGKLFPQRNSVVGDSKSLLEFSREFGDLGEDFWRLFAQSIEHAIAHFGAEAYQFQRRDNQGELIVNFMAHVREFAIQFSNLFWT